MTEVSGKKPRRRRLNPARTAPKRTTTSTGQPDPEMRAESAGICRLCVRPYPAGTPIVAWGQDWVHHPCRQAAWATA